MEYGVLGPLRVVRDGHDLTPRGQRARDLLAALVLRRGQSVDPQLLLDLVWESEAVSLDTGVVHTVVARLRRTLGSAAVETTAHGYRLGPGSVDADAFADLLRQARGTSHGAGVRLLEQALRLWRSEPAYAGISDALVAAERARLHELRLSTLESLVSGLVATNDADADAATRALALAEDLVSVDPLRERAHELVMLANYRLGRQADALAAHDRLRRLLHDELGLAPGPSATRLQAQILAHDPALELPSATAETPMPLPSPPAATTSLVGRSETLSLLLDAVAERRLVTLHGPGGVGKSRLLAAAHQQLREHGDVAYLDLASLGEADSTEVAEAVARSLGETAAPPDPVGSLCATLGDREVTVFLDEAEWSLHAVADVAGRMLRACPGVRLVASSRRALQLSGERLLEVAPLAVPSPGADAATVRESPAVALLLDRLSDHAPDLTARDTDLPALAEIARRVDGLPLALELVAAHADSHTIDDLVDLLEKPLDLAADQPDRPERHRSLRETILWSADRLPRPERQALRHLGVFVGAFDLSAAAAVVGSGGAGGAEDAATSCRALARDGLVQVQREPDGGLSWRLLRPVRDLALEGLEETGELADARFRHRRWHAARWRGALRSDQLIDDVRRRYDDYLEALRGALTVRDTLALADLTLTLGRLWVFTDAVGPGLRWFGRAIDSELVTDVERARIKVFRASLLLNHAAEDSRRDALDAIPVLTAEGDHAALVGAHLAPALLSQADGDLADALHHARKAVASGRWSTPERLADALGVLAIIESEAETPGVAHSTAVEAWSLARRSGSVAAMASVANNVCLALLELGRGDEVREILAALEERLGEDATPVFLTHTSAWAALSDGSPERALPLWATVVEAFPDDRADRWAAETYAGAGCALAALGDQVSADPLLSGARELFRRVGGVSPPWMTGLIERAGADGVDRPDPRSSHDLGAALAALVLSAASRHADA